MLSPVLTVSWDSERVKLALIGKRVILFDIFSHLNPLKQMKIDVCNYEFGVHIIDDVSQCWTDAYIKKNVDIDAN